MVNCSVCVCGKIFEIFMLLLVVMFWFLSSDNERVSGDGGCVYCWPLAKAE